MVARQLAEAFRGVQAPDQGKLGWEAFWAWFAEGLEVAVSIRVAFALVRGSRSGVGSAVVSRSKAYRDGGQTKADPLGAHVSCRLTLQGVLETEDEGQ